MNFQFEKAASVLSTNDPPIVLAKVDANEEQNKVLSSEYDVRGFPTLKILRYGGSLVQEYKGPRDADGIVTYLKKQSGPASSEFKSPEEASSIIDEDKILVVSLPSLYLSLTYTHTCAFVSEKVFECLNWTFKIFSVIYRLAYSLNFLERSLRISPL